MSAPPYSYSEGDVGLLYIPAGVGALLGSVMGGKISDVAANKWKHVPAARMFYGLIGSLVRQPLIVICSNVCLDYNDSGTAALRLVPR